MLRGLALAGKRSDGGFKAMRPREESRRVAEEGGGESGSSTRPLEEDASTSSSGPGRGQSPKYVLWNKAHVPTCAVYGKFVMTLEREIYFVEKKRESMEWHMTLKMRD